MDGDPELAIQAQQRHLLQVGYTDLALGRILDKLHETGSTTVVVVVVADHGVSFRPHGERRRVEEGNMEEIAFVPLFVKPPARRTAPPVDDHARTTDILPTIADILGVEVPWKTDGRSLLAGAATAPTSGPRPATSWSATTKSSSSAAPSPRAPDRPFRRGRRRAGALRDRPAPRLARAFARRLAGAVSGGPTFESYGESDYDPVAPFAPVRVYGRIVRGARRAGDRRGGQRARRRRHAELEHDGDTLVSAVTPEDAYRRARTACGSRRRARATTRSRRSLAQAP